MRDGDSVVVGDYTFAFKGAHTLAGPNYTALRGEYEVSEDGYPLVTLFPETRSYPTPPMQTTEAAILPTFWGDIYAVVGDADGTGGFGTRVYFKPLVSWMWGGTILMILGGFVSLADRRHRVGAPVRARRRQRTGRSDAVLPAKA